MFIGAICFGISGYSFITLQKFYRTFAYYGISSEFVDQYENTAKIIFDLRYGIIKSLFLGVIAWVISLILFIKSKKV